MIPFVMGYFKARFDCTGKFASYMTRSSYGIYILHYAACIYLILAAATFSLTPLLYETIRRIPFLRWCVLGMKTPSTKS